jgi:hypothetical protein
LLDPSSTLLKKFVVRTDAWEFGHQSQGPSQPSVLYWLSDWLVLRRVSSGEAVGVANVRLPL